MQGQHASRKDEGLPEDSIVFCCFNNAPKFRPETFSTWMRLLKAVEGSVLWLSDPGPAAIRNLSREAEDHGVAAERVVFARHLASQEDHFARIPLADIFLDTLPYNARTTANDALWAGVPVVTLAGEALAGRVATSLLHAIGLPELVTTSLAEYEAMALRLSADLAHLSAVRATLERNRLSCPLFDTRRFTRHIEAAYATMWEIRQRGEAPRNFAVEAIDPV